MAVLLQDYVPYHQSLCWHLQDAYYQGRGVAAWLGGDIPSMATSNPAQSLAHARLLVSLVKAQVSSGMLAPNGPIHVLEVASGAARGVPPFFRALETRCGTLGKDIAKRLVYTISDFSTRTLSEAIDSSVALSQLAAQGRVVPALLDMSQPQRLTDLMGREIQVPFSLLIASYACCVTPPVIFRKNNGHIETLFVATWNPEDNNPADQALATLTRAAVEPGVTEKLTTQQEWREITPQSLVGDGLHAQLLDKALEGPRDLWIAWPRVFFDLVVALRPRVRRGGALLVNDYGSADRDALAGSSERVPQVYGNGINHGVCFALFDDFCQAVDLPLVRTSPALRAVHSALIGYDEQLPRQVVQTFLQDFDDRRSSELFRVYSTQAEEAMKKGDAMTAAQLLEQCIHLSDGSPEVYKLVGDLYQHGQLHREALEWYHRGQRVDTWKQVDFDVEMARTWNLRGQPRDALKCILRSLKRADTALGWRVMGDTQLGLGHLEQAWCCFSRSLELDPSQEAVATAIASVASAWADKQLSQQASGILSRLVGRRL